MMRVAVGGRTRDAAPRFVEWVAGDAGSWTVPEAAPLTDFWDHVTTPISQRRGIARAFADAVRDYDGIEEMWATELDRDLEVVVVLEDRSIERDLRTIFIDLMCAHLDPSEGELRVFLSGEVPEWVQHGERLT